MSDSEIERLWKLVKELRQHIEQENASSRNLLEASPNKKMKGESFNKTQDSDMEARLPELQKKLGYKFTNELLLKRALGVLEDDHGAFKMLGKSIIQMCAHYHFVKENPTISKGKLQSSLECFYLGGEYGVEARIMKIDAFGRRPCGCNKRKIGSIECLYEALLGAIALDSDIAKAASIFLSFRKWNT